MRRVGPLRIKHRHQRGFALMALLAIVTAGLLYFLVGQMDAATMQRKRDQRTAEALAEGKAAIVAWSVTNNTAPGRLPCPEDTDRIGTPSEGQALTTCSNSIPTVGRLPWKTLGLDQLRDGYGEPLWYVLSPGFRNSPINADTPAQLTVDGNPVVAIVFSVGPPLGMQSRPVISAASPPQASDYLDLSNADGDTAFASIENSASFNDKLLAVTAQELFAAVGRRVTGEVVRGLLVYFCGGEANLGPTQTCLDHEVGPRNFPRPAQFSDSQCLGRSAISGTNCGSAIAGNEGRIPANPTGDWTTYDALSLLRGTTGGTGGNWFQSNGWRELTYIAISEKCIEPSINCDGTGNYLTVNTTSNIKAVVIMTGSALPLAATPQTHTSVSDKILAANYLEADNASIGDGNFTSATTSATFNDILGSIK